MALVKKDVTNKVNPYSYNPQSTPVDSYKKTMGDISMINPSSVSNLSSVAANNSGEYTSDDMKYVMASELAKNRLKDVDGITDDLFKETVDGIFQDELGATKTGREMRGENAFTDLIGGAKDAINGFNEMTGNLLDGIFDNTVGNLAGLFGEEAMRNTKDLFDGEDLAIVPDIAEDILLGMIPGVGIGLAGAKNAIQQSDNIAEAFSGKDNITREDLDPLQRLAKGAVATTSTALSMIPGAGNLGNMIKRGKNLDDIVEDGVESAVKDIAAKDIAANKSIVNGPVVGYGVKKTPALDKNSFKISQEPVTEKEIEKYISNADKNALEQQARTDLRDFFTGGSPFTRYKRNVKEGLDEAKKDLKGRVDKSKAPEIEKELDSLKIKQKKAKKEAKKSGETKELDDLNAKIDSLQTDLFGTKGHPIVAARRAVESFVPHTGYTQFAKDAQKFDAIQRLSDAAKAGIKRRTKSGLGSRMKDAAKGGSMMLGMGALNETAETGADPLQSLDLMLQRFNDDPFKWTATLMPVGARALARRAPSVRGKFGNNQAYNATRTAALANMIERMQEGDMEEGHTETEVLNALKILNDKE